MQPSLLFAGTLEARGLSLFLFSESFKFKKGEKKVAERTEEPAVVLELGHHGRRLLLDIPVLFGVCIRGRNLAQPLLCLWMSSGNLLGGRQ